MSDEDLPVAAPWPALLPWQVTAARGALSARARNVSDVSFGLSAVTPADIVTLMPGENALQSRSAIMPRSRSSACSIV